MFCVTASKAIVIVTVEAGLNVLNRSFKTRLKAHFITLLRCCLLTQRANHLITW